MKKVLGTGTAYISAASLLFVLSNYAIHVAIARMLGPAAYGTFGILMSLYLITTALLTTGIPRALSQGIASNHSLTAGFLKTASLLQLLFSSGIAVIYVLLGGVIASGLQDPELAPYLGLLGLLMIPTAGVILYQNGYWNGLRRFDLQAKIIGIHSLLRGVAVFFFLGMGGKIKGVVMGLLLAALLTWAGAWIGSRKLLPPPEKSKRVSAAQILRFALPLMGAALAFTAVKNINVLLVKIYLTDNILAGLYTAAATVANLPYMLFIGLPLTIMPSLSEALAAGNITLVQKYISRSLRSVLLLLTPLVLLGTIAAPEILKMFYTSTFVPAAPALQVLLASSALFVFFLTLTSMITAAGRPRWELFLNLISLVILLLLNHLLIPRGGVNGAALASLITSGVGVLCAGILVYRQWKILIPLPSILRIGACALAIFFLARLLPFAGVYLFLNGGLLGMCYFLLLYLTREVTEEDLELVRRIGRRKRRS